MKKLFLLFIATVLMFTISFAEVDKLVLNYLNDIELGEFDEEDLQAYEASMGNANSDQALFKFLEARIQLYDYKYKEAYLNLESALGLLENEEDSVLKAEILYYLADMDYFFFDLTSGTQRSVELRKLSEAIDYTKGIIESDYNIAFSYIYNYDYDQGMLVATEAFELSRQSDYALGIVDYTLFLGDLDYYYGDYLKAIAKYEEAFNLLSPVVHDYVVEEPHQLIRRVIGSDQIKNGDPEAGLQMLEELLESIDVKDTYTLFYVNYKIGKYYAESDPAKALDYYMTAQDLYFKSSIIDNADPYEVYFYKEIGNVNYDLGNYKEAADYYFKTLNFDYETDDDAVEAMLSGLDEIKYDEMNSKMSLLEQLNIANEERVLLSRYFIIGMFIGILLLLVAVVIIVIENRAKAKTEKELYYNSITDNLTKVYNRGKIIDIFSKNLKKDNSVLLLDLDNFKDINDTYGHIVGDEVLIKVTQIIKKSIRECDKLGRYGGEEFLVFIEGAGQMELHEIAERIRYNIENFSWSHKGLVTTASIGVTSCFSDEVEAILHEADTLMYKAKHLGKNRVEFG
ncbi:MULTISPECIES: GGDEF domain-containing protein [unclassified Fusibacter]|uniref:tetratricopeptide repeat-containing diguanylate cyclase n=1 Tax=unclassified Fusibacter TaxID=2624464 RepID=UPI0010104216|nr:MULTISPECIES: GGDEF domain-containing protein [unclassified Fusibacter]MCK8061088.1 GGDEF domain-containing protein [Fusibacter sp. A2]NPE23376.1 GGDEF domain-containing protein [Fusibacter sp. A1]RXV59421.1 GGDEF domain-containing protein [Fusibacter sp. A1]